MAVIAQMSFSIRPLITQFICCDYSNSNALNKCYLQPKETNSGQNFSRQLNPTCQNIFQRSPIGKNMYLLFQRTLEVQLMIEREGSAFYYSHIVKELKMVLCDVKNLKNNQQTKFVHFFASRFFCMECSVTQNNMGEPLKVGLGPNSVTLTNTRHKAFPPFQPNITFTILPSLLLYRKKLTILTTMKIEHQPCPLQIL